MRLPLIAASVLAGSFASFAGAQVTSQQPVAPKVPALKPLPPKPVAGPQVHPQAMISTLVGGSDDCSTAAANDAISGPGTFAFNTSTATTGTPVGSCGFNFGTDVWFYWTATATGPATVTVCGAATWDTEIAVWADGAPAGSCPTTQLSCNDDACGLQSTTTFNAVAGSKYFIEIGSYNSNPGGAGTFTITNSAPSGSDDCSLPIVISGTGTFPLDTTAATTGAPVGTCGAIGTDVWYRWTAPSSGTAIINTCGQISNDSAIAVWDGTGVPLGSCPSTQLACNDDSCGLQSQVLVGVTGGSVYYLEIGSFAGGAGYIGTFSISIATPPANDACLTPTVIVGAGPHAFDSTLASTGTEGQTEALCLAFGSTAIYNDLWFTWTAPTTSLYELSLCGGTGYDSRAAVYQGSGCPVAGTAIACNDDFCGLVSALCFSATAGQAYTIQVGAFGAGIGAPGSFTINASSGPVGPVCAPQDDGTTENSIGLTAGGALGWMVGFGSASSGSVTISSIETTYGTPLFPGGYVPSGPVTVAVWDDPNDDGNPTDAVLLGTTTAVVSPGSVDTDVFQLITLTSSVTVNGVFFAGAVVTHLAGEFPSPLDQSSGGGSPCGGGGPGSWVFGDTTGTANLTNLAANNVPPQSMASVGFPGNWLLRVNCGPGFTGTPYCFGDGTGTACPCGNTGAAGNGCASSVNAGGANLAATGTATVGSDTVVLLGTGMSNSSALYFQGTSQISVAFGDGLRCAGGTVIRLGTKTNVAGASQYPVAGDPPVSVRGLVPSGATRTYQIWYRNAAAFCTPSTFNLSNGLQIVWL